MKNARDQAEAFVRIIAQVEPSPGNPLDSAIVDAARGIVAALDRENRAEGTSALAEREPARAEGEAALAERWRVVAWLDLSSNGAVGSGYDAGWSMALVNAAREIERGDHDPR